MSGTLKVLMDGQEISGIVSYAGSPYKVRVEFLPSQELFPKVSQAYEQNAVLTVSGRDEDGRFLGYGRIADFSKLSDADGHIAVLEAFV